MQNGQNSEREKIRSEDISDILHISNNYWAQKNRTLADYSPYQDRQIPGRFRAPGIVAGPQLGSAARPRRQRATEHLCVPELLSSRLDWFNLDEVLMGGLIQYPHVFYYR